MTNDPEMSMNKPPCMVWLPVDRRFLGDEKQQMPFLILGEKYARAVKTGSNAQPVLFPLAQTCQIPELLDLVDGVMLTGSPSNIHPSHFDEEVADIALPLDPERDALTLTLIKECVNLGVPLLGICRGFQEINVALGGSLHQQVHAMPGLMDHREPKSESLGVQYGPRHRVKFEKGSVFERWAGGPEAMVNSLHGQGVARLAQGLRALAYGPDGLVEAFEVADAASFAYAVQWHPEWHFDENPFYTAIFKAFSMACHERQVNRWIKFRQ
jgi:putative glutamine amidotransferase